MKLSFLGAAGEVTGSCFLVEAAGARFLVDCGMFQGGRPAEAKNRSFAFAPGSIDFVLLTHAHLDHSGLLPRLAAAGFNGPVYTTAATADLLAVLLPDSGHLQELEAERAVRERKRNVVALYTVVQATACLKLLRPVTYEIPLQPGPGVRCVFRDAGHILGSASIEVQATENGRESTMVFSGDLGQPGHPIVRDPVPVRRADCLLVESTYGDRIHKNPAQTMDEFAYALTDSLQSRRGNVVIPAFAVGRTQDILCLIAKLGRQGRLGETRVFVDSPMAEAATRIVLAHPELEDDDAGALRDLVAGRIAGIRVELIADLEHSQRLNRIRSGAVIISASGMCDGGRIRHHLQHNLSRLECSVIFVGFQASGTLGRRIVEGAKTVSIFGQACPVRARIFTIGGLSAHADQEGLLTWLGHFERAPRRTWIVHGEALAAMAFQDAIAKRLGWHAYLAVAGGHWDS